jgi:uncharacterized protein (TIGR03067 family)
MLRSLALLLAVCGLASGQAPKLDGTWLPHEFIRGKGGALGMIWHSTLVIEGSKFTLNKPMDMEVPFTGQLKFDPKKANELDIAVVAHDLKGVPWQFKLAATTFPAIWELKDDVLSVAFPRDATKPRPKSFDVTADEYLLRFKQAPKDFKEYPKEFTVKVKDSTGPVADALVGTFISDQRLYEREDPKNPKPKSTEPKWEMGEHVKKLNDKGEVTIKYDDEMMRQAFFLAYSSKQQLMGVVDISPAQLAYTPEVTITLQPICTVSVKTECAELRGSTEDGGYNAYIYTPSGSRFTYAGNKTGELVYLLPPGEYRCGVYGSMIGSVDQKFTVPKDQSTYEPPPIKVPPTKFLKLLKNPAPELEGVLGWKGTPVKLADCKGKYVMLEFWGHWCGPCIGSMPVLFDLHDKYKDDLVVIGVHVDGEDDIDTAKKLDEKIKVSVEKAWKGRDLPFSSALISGKLTDDTENRSRGKAAEQYGVRSYPTTILIDREGKVVGHFNARDSKDALEQFGKLLKK